MLEREVPNLKALQPSELLSDWLMGSSHDDDERGAGVRHLS